MGIVRFVKMENKVQQATDYDRGVNDMFDRVKPHLENYDRLLKAYTKVCKKNSLGRSFSLLFR